MADHLRLKLFRRVFPKLVAKWEAEDRFDRFLESLEREPARPDELAADHLKRVAGIAER